MKRFLIIICLFLLQTSCEDVISVNLNEAPPRLVIEASIKWEKGTLGRDQEIKLSLSAPYFEKEIPPATGAEVKIIDARNIEYNFIENDQPGIYKNFSFRPILNEAYTLKITYHNETYVGTETFKPVVPIDYIEQNKMGGFTGEDTELKVYYTDPADEKNFYLFEFRSRVSKRAELSVYEDRYNNGNQIFGFYSEEDLFAGDSIQIKNYGISERFYTYMFILLQQSSDASGGPFETQPASVKGNCKNITNPQNYPLGYFRLSEVAQLTYVIQ